MPGLAERQGSGAGRSEHAREENRQVRCGQAEGHGGDCPKGEDDRGQGSCRRQAGAPKRRIDEMREYIQRRAYELWESEGRPAGRDQAHWLQAESEIARARGQRAGMIR